MKGRKVKNNSRVQDSIGKVTILKFIPQDDRLPNSMDIQNQGNKDHINEKVEQNTASTNGEMLKMMDGLLYKYVQVRSHTNLVFYSVNVCGSSFMEEISIHWKLSTSQKLTIILKVNECMKTMYVVLKT